MIAVKVKVIANEPLIANESILLEVREDQAVSESSINYHNLTI